MIKPRKLTAPAIARLIETLEGRRMFAFGSTAGTLYVGGTTYNTYTIDNGGNLQFTVLKSIVSGAGSSTVHLGDVTSIKYKGKETLATYGESSRFSHYEQGLGAISVVSSTIDPSATPQWIKVTADDSAETSGGVIQTYVVKRNDDNIYMTSLPTDVNNGPGEGRFIAYLSRPVFTAPELPSDNAPHSAGDVVSTIEGGDVFGHTDGAATVQTTSSKFFNSGRRMIDNTVHGLVGSNTGSTIGAYMYMGSREHSAGGPFFKDIDFQASSSQVELYNCIFTGHTQTEPYRQGLHVYAMQFTNGAAPVAPNYSFLEGLNISGLVPASARGAIGGVASGVPVGHESVVTLSNADAQYWGRANTGTGAYAISGVLPGTYTETLYDNELAVGTRTVVVRAGSSASYNIADTYYTPAATWRIGTWDGTPKEFLNADKIETEHPSDVRMASWVLPADSVTGVPTFNIGTDTNNEWPLAQFMGVNNSNRVSFTLTAAQAAAAQTLRIGITWGFSGARPKITVNAGQTYAWTSAIPTASSDLNSRGITRGTWRGDNQLYAFPIPASAFRAGLNTIDLPLVSGSYAAGQTWLSPNVAYDAIDLVPTATASVPTVTSVTLTPAGSNIGVNGTKAFTAVAKDANGNVITANLDWSAVRGTIDSNGNYIAPATPGSDTITATATVTKMPGYNTTSTSTSAVNDANTGSGSTTINVLTTAPTVATAAAASPSSVFSKKTTLTVLGADLNGEASLTYTWSVIGTPPGSVSFAAANGTNTGKSTVATFSQPGSYTFRATITNSTAQTVTSDVTVTVFDKKAWYQADTISGTALTDSSGANNTAALGGSYSYVAGVDGNAVRLTGGSVSLPTGIVSGMDDFTIGGWLKPDSVSTWSRFFDFGTGTSAYMFLTPRSSTGGIRFAITTSGGAGEQVINGPVLNAGVWTHLAVTLSGNTATLYVNGVAVGTNANVTTHPLALGNTANNYLGKSQFTADPALLGSVDDFRVYGTGLTASDISAWYNTAGSVPAVSSVAIDNGSGQRSMVRSITLNFSRAVTLGSTAVSLLFNGGTSSASLIVTATSSANTQYLVTFTGTGVSAGSLADGQYTLTLNAAQISTGAGRTLATSPTYAFFRLFGDADGNGAVDFNDFLSLQNSFGQSVGSPTFASSLDGDASGTIDFNDFLMLQNNFGKTATAARPVAATAKLTTSAKTASRR